MTAALLDLEEPIRDLSYMAGIAEDADRVLAADKEGGA